MESPEELGKLALRMKPDDRKRFREASVAIQKEENMAKTRTFASKAGYLSARRNQQQIELIQRGNLPSIFTYESLIRGIFMGIILLISAIGEFVFARWTIMPFGLGQWETSLVAVTIVVLSFEGLNSYLTFLRKSNSKYEDRLFLMFSSIGFLLLILLIFFGADVRQVLFQTSASLSSSNSLEGTVKAADTFFGSANASFVWLMVTLSAAITIIGGIAYHDVKNRILMALAIRKLYTDITKTEAELQRLHDQQSGIDSQMNSFEARFDHGFLKAQVEQQEAEQMKAAQNSGPDDGHQQNNSAPINGMSNIKAKIDSLVVLSPILLIMLALLIFFLFRGVANAETIICLDMSKSMESSDYEGRQTAFEKNVEGVAGFLRDNLMPGDKVKVLGITENSFSHPYFILEGQVSTNKGAFGEVVARDKLRLLQTWRNLKLRPVAKITDIFGALNLASSLFNPLDKNKKLILFSDMRHCTDSLDLETPQEINVETRIRQVSERHLVAPLSDVKIWCLGVHSAGKTPHYWRSLNAFWTEYFRKSKASEPIVFSIERGVLKYE